MAEYAGSWSYVSPTVGNLALASGAKIMGMPGFGSGPVYGFDAGPHLGMVYYSFGPDPGTAKVESTSTGVNPTETSYALYGHIIPLSLGKVRIGGEIIAGPFVENGLATFCISFGFPFDPGDTRTLTEIAFDSEVVWENGSFNTEPFTFRYYPGTLTQAVDPLETMHWGADGIAYRPQMLLWFENLPLGNTKFQKIPYVAAVIVDSTLGEVNLGSAFETLAYSPWLNYTSDDFETTGVTDGVTNGGMIIAQDASFLALIQQFNRFYRNWSLLQTDKLRIVDRGAHVTPDIVLDRSSLMGQVTFTRAEPTSVPRVLELSTIDPDADYTIVPSKAVRTLEPVNVSASVGTESVYLPLVMDSSTRMAVVTYTKYLEDVARKKVTVTAMMTGVEIEPGDFFAIGGLGSDFENNSFKAIETTHGANYTVEITAESYFNCGMPLDPYWDHVVLLMGFEGVDGSTGAPGMTDESPHHHGTGSPTPVAEVDTAQFKFGGSSLGLDGAGLVMFADSPDWDISISNSDPFTIEAWVYYNSIDSSLPNPIVNHAWSTGHISWSFDTAGVSEMQFRYSLTGSAFDVAVVSSGAALGSGVWYHLAVDKSASGKIRLYKNGVMVGSATPANSAIYASDANLAVGRSQFFGAGTHGFIDEIRITKGICRYGSDGGFPVPTRAYPRSF